MKRKQILCIICNQFKCKGDIKLYRIGERQSAKNLLLAARFFKDDIHTRCVLWETPGDVFAADVMYHKNCLSGYVLKFKREVEQIMSEGDNIEDENTETIIKDVLMTMDLTSKAYHLSDIREEVSRQLSLHNEGESIFFFFTDVC